MQKKGIEKALAKARAAEAKAKRRAERSGRQSHWHYYELAQLEVQRLERLRLKMWLDANRAE